jgi:phosphoribosyl 1,2-cyclic phosphodiesterase
MTESEANSLVVSLRGVRGSLPSPGPDTARFGGNTSCVEVRAGHEILILDAGTGVRALGTDLVAEFGSRPIEATLLISHTHWDHIQGLPFFTPAFSAENRIHVFAAKGAGATIARGLRNQMDPIHFPVGFEQMLGLTPVAELAADPVDLGPFTIRVAALNHPGGCAGFRIEANGRSLAYLPDHEPFERDSNVERTEALMEFARGVDLLILDTQYTDAEYRHRRGWGHGCLSESVALALGAEVQHLALFHHDPSHDDEQIDVMVERARELAGGSLRVTAASENEIVRLGSIDVPLFHPQTRDLVGTVAA